MVLGVCVGWAVEAFAHVPNALPFGFLLGVVAANFVPLDSGCGE